MLLSMEDLGYPKSLVGVEKSLKELMSEAPEALPDRRVDIVCFSAGHFKPLLIVECKAQPTFLREALQQVMGYNHFLQAAFVAVATPGEIVMGWYDSLEKGYRFIEGLLPYKELMEAAYG